MDWRDLLKKFISERRVLMTDDDIPSDEVYEDFFKNVNYVRLTDSADVDVYLILPKDVKLSDDLVRVFRVLSESIGDDRLFTKLVSDILYEFFADVLEYGDSLAWLLFTITRDYEIKPDEVVDTFDYKHSYTGKIYYRFGDTWICVNYKYVNYNRYGISVGIQKGRVYSFEKPN